MDQLETQDHLVMLELLDLKVHLDKMDSLEMLVLKDLPVHQDKMELRFKLSKNLVTIVTFGLITNASNAKET